MALIRLWSKFMLIKEEGVLLEYLNIPDGIEVILLVNKKIFIDSAEGKLKASNKRAVI